MGIDGSKGGGGARDGARLSGSNFFHFHAFFGKNFGQIIDWRPHLGGSGKCWIRHWWGSRMKGEGFQWRIQQLGTVVGAEGVKHEIPAATFDSHSFYRPHLKDGEGTTFTGVCLSTGGGRGYSCS